MENQLVNKTAVVAAVVITLLQRPQTMISHPHTTPVRLTASRLASQEEFLEQVGAFLSRWIRAVIQMQVRAFHSVETAQHTPIPIQGVGI
jgi:hypothetical protein